MRFRVRAVVGLFLLIASSQLAFGDLIGIGTVSFDPTNNSFTIDNFTGGSQFAPDFPVTTSITWTSLILAVSTMDQSNVVSSMPFKVSNIVEGSPASPQVVVDNTLKILSFSLTGTFAPMTVMLSGGGTADLIGNFSAALTNADYINGSAASITADTVPQGSTVPEPTTAVLIASGLVGFWRLRKRNLK